MDGASIQVQLEDGSILPLEGLNDGNPFALVFLRHFGCIFCRYQVAQLRREPGLPIVFVGMETVEQTSAFKRRMRSPHRFVADPERRVYEKFGIGRAGWRKMVTAKGIRQGVRAMMSGQFQGVSNGDPMQLGAAFVVDGRGKIAWSRLAEDASDIVDAQTLRAQLLLVEQREAGVGGEDDPRGVHSAPTDQILDI